eukprot:757076-Hanusia_phi.AAC.7
MAVLGSTCCPDSFRLQVVYLQTQCSNLEKEITRCADASKVETDVLSIRYQHLDKECQDLHEYSQLLEEEVEESNRKLQEQQQTIRKLEEMLSESQLKVNETDSLRTRLAQADAAVLERDKIIARMRSAASVVDRGITEMQMRYDEILARMADEIVASQARTCETLSAEVSLTLVLSDRAAENTREAQVQDRIVRNFSIESKCQERQAGGRGLINDRCSLCLLARCL